MTAHIYTIRRCARCMSGRVQCRTRARVRMRSSALYLSTYTTPHKRAQTARRLLCQHTIGNININRNTQTYVAYSILYSCCCCAAAHDRAIARVAGERSVKSEKLSPSFCVECTSARTRKHALADWLDVKVTHFCCVSCICI